MLRAVDDKFSPPCTYYHYGMSSSVSTVYCMFSCPQPAGEEPTRKQYIIYLIFCPDELVNSIMDTERFLYDHNSIYVSYSILHEIPQSTFRHKVWTHPTKSLRR